MKKNFKYFMLFAAVTVLSACVKENMGSANVEASKIEREFILDVATKTDFSADGAKLNWVVGDRIGVHTTDAAAALMDKNVSATKPEEGNLRVELTEGATTVYAYYPYVYATSTLGNDAIAKLEEQKMYVKPSQNQDEAGKLNGAMLPMWTKATLASDGPTVLKFNPAASLLAVNVYGKTGEKLSYVRFAPVSGNIAGLFTLNLGAENVEIPAVSKGKTSVTSSLVKLYDIPASKPADRSGLVYLAAVPGSYAGGVLTIATDKSLYEVEISQTLDLTNVYRPYIISVNLADKTPVANYLYYDNMGEAAGHLKDYGGKYTGTEVRTAQYSINVGTNKAAGTLVTPAFDFLGDETKDVKVSFFANGWNKPNLIAVTANVGEVVGGSALSMNQLANTVHETYFSMDKSKRVEVVIKGATKATQLTVTNDATDAVESKRFVIDDFAVEEYVESTEPVVAYTLDMTSKIGQGDFNMTRTTYGTYNGVSWTLTKCATNNKNYSGVLLGTNSKNYSTCKLTDENALLNNRTTTGPIDYSRIGTPCGYEGTTQGVTAAVSEQPMKKVQKVVVYNDIYDGVDRPEKISLVYSTDDKTYTLLGTQDYNAYSSGTNEWTFEQIPEAYFAIVLYKSVTGNMIAVSVKADFYAMAE